MARPTVLPHAKQIELWRLARDGDASAADELALSVWSWARRKAGQYARKYHVDPDDLESIGMERFSDSMKNFRPELGWTFLNYFGSNAARAMFKAANRECERRKLERPNAEADAPHLDSIPWPDADDEPPDDVRETIAFLDTIELRMLEQVHGVRSAPVPITEAGRILGLAPGTAEAVYDAGYNRLNARNPNAVAAMGVRRAVRSLEPLERGMIQFVHGFGKKAVSVPEAAAKLGISPETAEVVYGHAFNHLSDRLTERNQ